MQFHNKALVERAYTEGSKSKDAFAMHLPVVDEGTGKIKSSTDDLSTAVEEKTAVEMEEAAAEATAAPTKIEIAKLQGYTGSMCSGCGSSRVKRNGSCEVCLDCGATSGCS